MLDLSRYRDSNGRININLAEDDGLIEIDRNPQQSMAGARPKNWCYSPQGDILFKQTLPSKYEDYGEVLGEQFAKLIGLPCAEYDFATFNGQQGVITGDVEGTNEELIGGDLILREVNSLHIAPIQKTCLEYHKVKQSKESGKQISEYLNSLIELYNKSSISYIKF